MDVSAPITAAIPGISGLVVAALLPTTEPLNMTRISKGCPGASESGVRSAVRRLAASGLVLKVPGGFTLNRDHLVFPAVALLDGLHGALKRRIQSAIEQWGGAVSVAGIYGSAARRDGHATSDIDLMLVSDDPDADDFSLELQDSVERWTGNFCHVMVLTPSELHKMVEVGEPLVAEWRLDLVTVVGSLEAEIGSATQP